MSSEKEQIDLAIKFATEKFSKVGKKNHFLRVLSVLENEFFIDAKQIVLKLTQELASFVKE